MEDFPLWFPVVPNDDRAFSHHLELGLFPSDFIFSSVPGPCFRDDEKIGRSREVVDLFKNNNVKFTCVVF